jgi:hypothetical protein
MHSVVLDEESPTYLRNQDEMSNYYYEAIRMNVTETGEYTLFAESDIDTYGYIYIDTFDPKNPSTNQESQGNDGCGGLQFKIVIFKRLCEYISTI